MRTTRRMFAAGVLLLGFMALATLPASAQVDGRQVDARYVGVAAPALGAAVPVGGVLSVSGQRTTAAANQAQAAQVLASQTSSGAVAATAQAPVQGLAFTGADIAGMVTIALSAIALGTILSRRARPRSLPKQ